MTKTNVFFTVPKDQKLQMVALLTKTLQNSRFSQLRLFLNLIPGTFFGYFYTLLQFGQEYPKTQS